LGWNPNETHSDQEPGQIRTKTAKIGETPGTVAVTEVDIKIGTEIGVDVEIIIISEGAEAEAVSETVEAFDRTPNKTKPKIQNQEINNDKKGSPLS
jgi:hypothetical protein